MGFLFSLSRTALLFLICEVNNSSDLHYCSHCFSAFFMWQSKYIPFNISIISSNRSIISYFDYFTCAWLTFSLNNEYKYEILLAHAWKIHRYPVLFSHKQMSLFKSEFCGHNYVRNDWIEDDKYDFSNS
jgi:hypothetical protein